MEKLKSILIFLFLAGVVIFLAPRILKVVASGNLTGLNFNSGIFYYSLDAGDTFINNSSGLSFAEINNFVFGPNRKAYLSTSQGIFVSDGGTSKWEKIKDKSGLFNSSVPVSQIAFIGGDGNRILVAVYKGGRGRIYRSEDNFKNFKEVYATSAEGTKINDLKFDKNSGRIYFVASDGIVGYSDDGGITFGLLKNLSVDLRKIILTNQSGNVFYVLGEKVLYKSVDYGASFVDLSSNIRESGIIHPENVSVSEWQTVFLASAAGCWRSDDGGFSWIKMDSLLPKNLVCGAAIRNDSRQEILAGFDGRIYRSVDGKKWSVRTINQSNFVSELAVDPENPNLVLAILRRSR